MQKLLNSFGSYTIIFFILFFLGNAFAQQREVIHKPQTSVIIPGLRREFKAELAHITLEVNPGWRAQEIFDSTEKIYQLVFTDPDDSSKRFLSLLLENYRTDKFDSTEWNKLKQSIRVSYGNRGIALHELSDLLFKAELSDSSGILARYELLTKQKDYLEYINAMVGRTSLILLTVPLTPEEYDRKIAYFMEVAQSLKLYQ
jgi:hypothetical protein